MVKKSNEIVHKIFASLPLLSFFLIIIFIYTVYMTTYLGKLLTNEYDYDKSTVAPSERFATFFITMRTITTYTDSMVNKLQTEEVGLTQQEQKGAIYFIISHVLLLLLFIAIFRTIFTSPGNVPVDWSLSTENELYNAAELEKRILVENYRRKRRTEGSQPSRSPLTEEEKFSNFERDELIGQGGQGEELGRGTGTDDYPDDPQMIEQLNQMAFLNAMKKENKRFCTHCQMFKPERTHHCRQCNTCILKMDHHCPWVGNCVGFKNYKFFINMVFYGVLMLWFVVVTYTEVVSDTLFNPYIKSGIVFLIFFMYTLTAVLSIVITGFFFFHIWLIIQGRTTLEFVEEKNTSDYSNGFWENLKSALGSNIFLWCLPLSPHLEKNGLHFKTHAKFIDDDDL